MEQRWKYVKPLENTLVIREYLKKYHISLPDDIVELLEKYNGGRPANKEIITETNREYVFKTLLSYNKGDKETIYSVYPEPFKKRGLYPVASDAAGNYICYEQERHTWVLYNHEVDKVEKITEMALY